MEKTPIDFTAPPLPNWYGELQKQETPTVNRCYECKRRLNEEEYSFGDYFFCRKCAFLVWHIFVVDFASKEQVESKTIERRIGWWAANMGERTFRHVHFIDLFDDERKDGKKLFRKYWPLAEKQRAERNDTIRFRKIKHQAL